MQKYQFVEENEKNPAIINYGELGPCQLLCNRNNNQFYVLKLAPKFEALKDIQFLTQIQHPNVIKVIQYFTHEQSLLIIFQFLPGGDLYKKIRSKEIKKHHIAPIFRGICSAISYIHSRKLIHRNLKTQTILLDEHMNPKVIDFGMAARLTTRQTFCGCFYYMSPQLLNNSKYNQKADIWALGIILYEMIYGEVPFNKQTSTQILECLSTWEFYRFKYIKGSAQQLIQAMLNPDIRSRPTIKQILQHPFLQTQPLNFFKQPKVKSNQTFYKIEKNKTMDQIKRQRGFQKRMSRPQSKNEKGICQRIRLSLNNKYLALIDRGDISRNSRYNFVVNP